MSPLTTPVLLILVAAAASAQPPSPWQGEWGAFSGDRAQQGRRLSIHDCDNTTCKFSIESRSATGNGGTASVQALTILSGTAATAILPGETAKPPVFCALSARRVQSRPSP